MLENASSTDRFVAHDQLFTRETHSRDVCEAAMTGAQFEIRIDGTPRSYRDRNYAMQAARLLKNKNPHSMVEVKDLRSGDVLMVEGRNAL
jgi:hypothetical protein